MSDGRIAFITHLKEYIDFEKIWKHSQELVDKVGEILDQVISVQNHLYGLKGNKFIEGFGLESQYKWAAKYLNDASDQLEKLQNSLIDEFNRIHALELEEKNDKEK